MAVLPKLEGLIPLSAVATATVVEHTPNNTYAGTTLAAAGDYYLTAGTSLLAVIQQNLNNLNANSTYTVTVDSTSDTSTGKVTIAVTGVATFDITWTDTVLRDILGFTGNLSGAATYTGGNQARYLFLPPCGRSPSLLAPDGDAGVPLRDGNLNVAPDGTLYAMSFATRYVDRIGFSALRGSSTWTYFETTVNQSLQTFWVDVISKGYPFRYFPVRSAGSSRAWVSQRIDAFEVTRVVDVWHGASALYGWESDVVQNV